MNPQEPNNPNENQPGELPGQSQGDSPQETPPNYYPPPAHQPSWQPPPVQPPYYGQPGQGPGYGYGYPVYPKQANGTLILILGILSLCSVLCCPMAGVVLGPLAWVLGNNSLKDIDTGIADPTQRGSVVGGRVCGIVGTVLAALATGATALIYAYDFHKALTSP